MASCLFTGKKLGLETKREHTIPRSLGGRIRSRIVSSNEFNQNCSDGIDNILSDAFKPMYNYLGPLLSRELRPGSIKVTVANSSGRHIVRPGGKLEGVGFSPIEWDSQGRPTRVEGEENAVLKFAKSQGVRHSEYHREYFPREPVTVQIYNQFSKEIELAALKSSLLTFDHLLANEGIRFTRDRSLRKVIKLVAAIITGRMNAKELFTKHVWGVDYEILEPVQRLREKYGEGKTTPFEHILVAGGNAATKTVDIVWCIFGFEPYKFRLTWDWHGPDFNYLVTSGVLKNTNAPTNAVEFVSPFRLGRRSKCRSIVPRQEYREDELLQLVEKLIERRIDAYRRAVDLVERSAEEFVKESMVSNSKYLLCNGSQYAALAEGIREKLKALFWDRLQSDGASVKFNSIFDKQLEGVSIDRASDYISEDETTIDGIDWDYWFDFYRDILDSLKSEFGLPGALTYPKLDSDILRYSSPIG